MVLPVAVLPVLFGSWECERKRRLCHEMAVAHFPACSVLCPCHFIWGGTMETLIHVICTENNDALASFMGSLSDLLGLFCPYEGCYYDCCVSLCPSCTLFLNAGLCRHLWWWLYPWWCGLPRLQTWLCVPRIFLHARYVHGTVKWSFPYLENPISPSHKCLLMYITCSRRHVANRLGMSKQLSCSFVCLIWN